MTYYSLVSDVIMTSWLRHSCIILTSFRLSHIRRAIARARLHTRLKSSRRAFFCSPKNTKIHLGEWYFARLNKFEKFSILLKTILENFLEQYFTFFRTSINCHFHFSRLHTWSFPFLDILRNKDYFRSCHWKVFYKIRVLKSVFQNLNTCEGAKFLVQLY